MAKHEVAVRSRIFLSIAIFGSVLSPSLAIAQVTPDGTLGTQVNGSLTAPCVGTCIITDGSTRGRNLFHSFQQFSLPNGDFAAFITDSAIQNVIVRVTGIGQPFISNINGTIATTDPTVSNVIPTNFFLLNPNGIVFGSNARVFVGSSFLASTAERMLFQDGTVFDIYDRTPSPLLTVSVPTGLQFGQTPGEIRSSLRIGTGINSRFTNIAFVGGDVTLDGSIVFAPGGQIEVGGVRAVGTVGLNLQGNSISLEFPSETVRADVRFLNRSQVGVEAGEGGSIVVNARNVEILNSSLLSAGIAEGEGRAGKQAGDISLNATEKIEVINANVNNIVQNNAIGNGGNLNITADSLSLTNGAQLAASTFGQGNAGNIFVQAKGITLDGSAIISNVEQTGVGKGGNIALDIDTLTLTTGAQLIVNTNGQGDAGNILVRAKAINLDGSDGTFFSSMSSSVNRSGAGKGGNIDLTTNTLTLTNGAQLIASTHGQGDAGDVLIRATDNLTLSDRALLAASTLGQGDAGDVLIHARTITLDGKNSIFPSAIFSTVEASGVGKSGSINLYTDSLTLTNGTRLAASTSGQGDAGVIFVRAKTLSLDDSFIFSTVNLGGIGKSGDITLTTDTVTLTRGSQLATSTFGQGDAGNIFIVSRSINLDGINDDMDDSSGIFSNVGREGRGSGGVLNLSTDTVTLTRGAQLATSTFGQGDAGNIFIRAKTITLDGSNSTFFSGIFSTVVKGALGKGSNIDLSTDILSLANDAQLDAGTHGQGDAGNILVRATAINIDGDQTAIRTGVGASGVGNGGNIDLHTDTLTLTNGGALVASARGTGNAGNIQVTAKQSVQISGVNSQGVSSGLFVASSNFKTGNITISTPNLRLDNQGTINAQSPFGNGGNITLNIANLLLLRSGSTISTSAGNFLAGGDGGNITINAPKGFIIGVKSENSDITANAFSGSGGRINITAQGIYGLQFRPRLTEFSDITASSTFGVSGIVTLNTPNVDPSRGLSQLPQNLIDTNRILENSCLVRDASSGGTFVITGTGGLPVRPGDAVLPTFATGEVRGIEEARRNGKDMVDTQSPNPKIQHERTIAEAQGIYKLPDGQIILSWECKK